MLGFPLGILSAAGAGGVAGDYELIATEVLGSATSEVTFSSLATYASTYKHLQIRYVARSDRGIFSTDRIGVRLNGNTTNTNYASHFLNGDGEIVGSNATTGDNTSSSVIGTLTGSGSETGSFAAGVVDLLDPFSTTKNKTLRNLNGQESQTVSSFPGRFIQNASVLFISTSSVTSLSLSPRFSTNFVLGSRFSLYGIRG